MTKLISQFLRCFHSFKVYSNRFYSSNLSMVPLPKNLNDASQDEIVKFLGSFDTVLSDCDGVLWLENDVIEGSPLTVNRFMDMKKTFYYVTNNNSKTREEYAEKCAQLGFRATKENIICTAYLAAEYLRSINFDKKVYIIGSSGIAKEFDKVGIRHCGVGPDVLDRPLDSYIKNKLNLDPEIGAVLVGFDMHISYPKLLRASTYLKNPNCHFLATCPDESFPKYSNLLLPGTGCFVKFLEAASGRKAFILGKPHDYIKQAIFKKQEFNPTRTLMIGDRCNTDILFGKRCGFQTLLVLSGIQSNDDVEKFAQSSNPDEQILVPNFCINKLGDLLPYLKDN